jgi:beta-glucosidase-like glycosyl hydrolase
VHSGPEPLRHGFDAKASAHDIEDTYLPAFRAAVVEGKVTSVMCVYNAINGVPGCASEYLLDGTLRHAWKSEGFVTGDCDAVRDIETGHKYARTAAEAGAFAVKAGLDNDCTTSGLFDLGGPPDYQRYVDAVKQGLLSEAEIDVALKRMLRPRVELGLFDPLERVEAAQVPDAELDSPAHRELALKLARESMVLLKNDGVLPFAQAPARIAVVGPLADNSRVHRAPRRRHVVRKRPAAAAAAVPEQAQGAVRPTNGRQVVIRVRPVRPRGGTPRVPPASRTPRRPARDCRARPRGARARSHARARRAASCPLRPGRIGPPRAGRCLG